MRSDRFLSVIIPTYNRARRLPLLLDALFAQDINHRLSEVIVVNDGSTDATWALLEAKKNEKKDPWLRVLTQANQGQAVARQYGVNEARGDIVLFLDDDMEPVEPGFLRYHLEHHTQSSTHSVALGAILPPKDNPFRPAFELFYEKSIHSMYDSFRAGQKPDGRHFFSANVSLPKDLYLRVGGFDAKFRQAEDRELGLRLQQNTGAPFVFLEKAAAYHNSQTGRFQSFLQRARLYGHYDLQIALMYPSLPDLHPRWIFRSQNSLKRALAHLAFRIPFLVSPLSWLLVPSARFFHRLGLHSLSIAACSVLYCLQYVDGYRLSPSRAQDKTIAEEINSDAA